MEQDTSELVQLSQNSAGAHEGSGIRLVHSALNKKQKDVPWPAPAPTERPQQPLQLSLFG